MSINTVQLIDDRVKVKNVLISVSDKAGLDEFIPALLKVSPEIRFLSTGGTFGKIKEILEKSGLAKANLIQVSDYTGQPETQGGLVKTLDFKIYLGLLTETYNDAHRADLARTGAVDIDMAVVNLYPFKETVSKKDVTPEAARGNIDIGGPCMIRASAKNFLRVASVVNPKDYQMIAQEMTKTGGYTTLALRYKLAQKAFAHTADYDRGIADYLMPIPFDTVKSCYTLK